MTRIHNMCLLLERFLTDYYDLLISFSQVYAPSEADLVPDPRYLKSCLELPYIIFFLQYMQARPLEFLEIAEQWGLPRQLARALDYYEEKERRSAV